MNRTSNPRGAEKRRQKALATRLVEKLSRVSGCIAVAVIVVQEPAEALTMPHLTAVASHIWLWSNQSVVETLMIALGMRVAHILVGCIRQRAFTQHQHLLQGLFFDGAHKLFTIGVEIWTARRQDDRLLDVRPRVRDPR